MALLPLEQHPLEMSTPNMLVELQAHLHEPTLAHLTLTPDTAPVAIIDKMGRQQVVVGPPILVDLCAPWAGMAPVLGFRVGEVEVEVEIETDPATERGQVSDPAKESGQVNDLATERGQVSDPTTESG